MRRYSLHYLMSQNERQSQTNVVINDKLQGTTVTYLRLGEISVTKFEIQQGLSPSLPVNFFEIDKYLAYIRAKRWIVSCTFFDFMMARHRS